MKKDCYWIFFKPISSWWQRKILASDSRNGASLVVLWICWYNVMSKMKYDLVLARERSCLNLLLVKLLAISEFLKKESTQILIVSYKEMLLNKIFTSRLAKNKLECWFKISLKHSNESLTVNSFKGNGLGVRTRKFRKLHVFVLITESIGWNGRRFVPYERFGRRSDWIKVWVRMLLSFTFSKIL